ncbi:protein of unknown function [Modestobacter italicus]|uniref:Uncharacterized protein n=1 Tax=Modestobacter italicus (strain DSM 44449 / CECT 9708 / BC 501) TaxID=2732864 RepID=I4F0L2_MODI5|nr:protein of unknown function [Modestobacter marinus]
MRRSSVHNAATTAKQPTTRHGSPFMVPHPSHPRAARGMAAHWGQTAAGWNSGRARARAMVRDGSVSARHLSGSFLKRELITRSQNSQAVSHYRPGGLLTDQRVARQTPSPPFGAVPWRDSGRASRSLRPCRCVVGADKPTTLSRCCTEEFPC